MASSRSMASQLGLIGLIVAGLLLAAWLFQRRLIYFPFGTPPRPAEVGLADAEVISFPTEDGLSLAGWFVPSGAEPSPTVIVFNGNAGNRAYRAALAEALVRAGTSVLLFDYRGYGGNPGRPSEEGLAADARAAVTYARARADVDPARIVYFGESLGTGVAVGLAAEDPPARLILRSPFTSLADVGRHHYPFLPVGLLLKDRYDVVARLPRIACPLLVIAGEHDRIVPFESSRRVYEAAREPKRLVTLAADHNDMALLAGDEMMVAIRRFLGEL